MKTLRSLFIATLFLGGICHAQLTGTVFETPGTTTYIVPAGVTQLKVKLWGAGGGKGPAGSIAPVGGGAAFVTGILNVTPGETLQVLVGGGGQPAGNGGAPGAAGINGGGAGGSGSVYVSGGAGGGGRSALQRVIGTDLVVAGGGGGGGGGGSSTATPATGGAGGLGTGTAGTIGIDDLTTSGGGGGGTQVAGGAGGVGPVNGSAGFAKTGGAGGSSEGGGGGGGGGYFGGGGGAASNTPQFTMNPHGGGGGGGSSLLSNLEVGTTTGSEAGSGKSAGGKLDVDYATNAGEGGWLLYTQSLTEAGGNGRVVLIPVPAAAIAGSVAFAAANASSLYRVPAGVTELTVKAWGAGGGGGGATGGVGGGGAFVTGKLAVTPGELLIVRAATGGQGGFSAAGPRLASGGQPGGGYGARDIGIPFDGTVTGGGGGGGRTVVQRADLVDLIVAAGGGGGAGKRGSVTAGAAGAGGLGTGASGGIGTGPVTGGSGGTVASGGAAGASTGAVFGVYLAGTAGTGGNGTFAFYDEFGGGGSGGGGGAGLFGGGGGGGYYGASALTSSGGAGGGGSSLLSNLTSTAGSAAGSGATPGATGDADYVAGVGVGGAVSTAGGGGRVVIIPTAAPVPQASFTTGMDASVVVGQANFTDQVTVASQTVMRGPAGAAVNATGKLAISDQEDGRVLIWNTVPTVNGTPADVVVGKPDFTDVTGGVTASRMNTHIDTVTFSPDGTKLIAADSLNNRVLIWNTVPTVNGAAADVVIGQTDFVTATAGTSATKLNHPAGLAVSPDGKLFIVEVGNNRVLIYNSIPTVNGAAANVVIGQTDFVSAGTGSGASQLNQPWGVSLSPDGRLLVGDTVNNRVLVFNTVPASNGAAADVVIGQTGFGLAGAATSATGLNQPFAPAVSASGKLAIADNASNRVLIYNSIPAANGAAANVVLGQPDFTTGTAFTGGVSAHSMSSSYGLAFAADGRLIVPGTTMQRAMIFGRSGPVPVTSTFGDVVNGSGAPDTAGADSGAKFDVLRRGGYLAENGQLVFPGYLLIGTGGVTLTPNTFMGLWKHDGTSLKLLARSGNAAPETGGALFDVLPQTPAINDSGEVTFLASLVVGTGAVPVTVNDDTGLWSELGATGLGILLRENDPVPGISGAFVRSFASGAYATAHTGASTGEAAFAIAMKGATSDTAILRTSITGPTVTAVGIVARENTAMSGVAGEQFGSLAGSYTDSMRMDATGNLCFVALSKTNRESIWYQPNGGTTTKAFIAGTAATGDIAPGTGGATFKNIKSPSIGSGGTISFRGFLNTNGDNTLGKKGDGIWRGTTAGGFNCILRAGDDNTNRVGLGLPAGAKVGNLWHSWLTNANHGAWRGWLDLNGDGTSAAPTDVNAIYTDLSGTMVLALKAGDAAPGIASATFASFGLPVVGGVEQFAILGNVTGGGTTAANNWGIWRSAANGGALSLVLRAGDTMITTQGTKTIAKMDLPDSGSTDRRWEQPIMDSTGRLLVYVTFVGGGTSQIFVP